MKFTFDRDGWYIPAVVRIVWTGVPCLFIWASGLPGSGWAAGFLAGSAAVSVCHAAVLGWRQDRWNSRGVAAARSGRWDATPSPRGSPVALGVAWALAVAGLVFLILGLMRPPG